MTLFGKIAKRWFSPLFLLLRLFLLALLVANGIVDVAVVATIA